MAKARAKTKNGFPSIVHIIMDDNPHDLKVVGELDIDDVDACDGDEIAIYELVRVGIYRTGPSLEAKK